MGGALAMGLPAQHQVLAPLDLLETRLPQELLHFGVARLPAALPLLAHQEERVEDRFRRAGPVVLEVALPNQERTARLQRVVDLAQDDQAVLRRPEMKSV